MQFSENYDPVQTKNFQSKKKNPPHKELGHVKAFQPLFWQENWEKTFSKWLRLDLKPGLCNSFKIHGSPAQTSEPFEVFIDKISVSVSPVFLSSTRWANICAPVSF